MTIQTQTCCPPRAKSEDRLHFDLRGHGAGLLHFYAKTLERLRHGSLWGGCGSESGQQRREETDRLVERLVGLTASFSLMCFSKLRSFVKHSHEGYKDVKLFIMTDDHCLSPGRRKPSSPEEKRKIPWTQKSLNAHSGAAHPSMFYSGTALISQAHFLTISWFETKTRLKHLVVKISHFHHQSSSQRQQHQALL